jgi:expansin (peptidoglycan-binding protein)
VPATGGVVTSTGGVVSSGGAAGGGAGGGGGQAAGMAGGGLAGGGATNGGASGGGASGGVSGGAGGMSGGAGGSATGGSATGGVPNPPGTCGTTWANFTNYQGNGSITYYEFNMGTKENVNCNFGIAQRAPDRVNHVYTGEGRYFAAINTSDWRNAAACGACIDVTGPRGTVTVTVVDQCPVASNPLCQAGHLDLSREAFRQIANEVDGIVRNISWRFVPCPVPDNQDVTVRVEQPDNQYYTTVLVQDHIFPIQSLQIKGQMADRRQDPNSGNRDGFFIVGDGNQAPAPWPIRVQDVNGWIYEATVALNQSGDVTTNMQAECD